MSELINSISDYYTRKLNEFGATAKGADWNSDESQHLRFEKLLSFIAAPASRFSLLDYGCGFGSMYRLLNDKFTDFDYTGYDISSAMINAAELSVQAGNARWINSLPENKTFDYVIASGIFNVKLHNSEEVWLDHMHSVLHEMNARSSIGFAFNVLSSNSDPEKRKTYLHYADPYDWVDYVKKNFSNNVTLLHDYPLYEFTIQVKK